MRRSEERTDNYQSIDRPTNQPRMNEHGFDWAGVYVVAVDGWMDYQDFRTRARQQAYCLLASDDALVSDEKEGRGEKRGGRVGSRR